MEEEVEHYVERSRLWVHLDSTPLKILGTQRISGPGDQRSSRGSWSLGEGSPGNNMESP